MSAIPTEYLLIAGLVAVLLFITKAGRAIIGIAAVLVICFFVYRWWYEGYMDRMAQAYLERDAYAEYAVTYGEYDTLRMQDLNTGEVKVSYRPRIATGEYSIKPSEDLQKMMAGAKKHFDKTRCYCEFGFAGSGAIIYDYEYNAAGRQWQIGKDEGFRGTNEEFRALLRRQIVYQDAWFTERQRMAADWENQKFRLPPDFRKIRCWFASPVKEETGERWVNTLRNPDERVQDGRFDPSEYFDDRGQLRKRFLD